MKKTDARPYLMRARQLKITPNFFTSEAYLRLSKAVCYEDKGWLWVQDKDWTILPPLPTTYPVNTVLENFPAKKVWALWPDTYRAIDDNYTFLDYQYIYNPRYFENMVGSKWEVFRKNCRKWSKRNPGWIYNFKEPSREEAGELIAAWLDNKQQTVQDGELLAQFAYFNHDGNVFRRFLYNAEGKLMAINACDINWKYINYRVCMVKLNEPFLDEFIRLLFYTDTFVRNAHKLVNDGGTLGNAGLERFKDKLNPMRKDKIYSWINNAKK